MSKQKKRRENALTSRKKRKEDAISKQKKRRKNTLTSRKKRLEHKEMIPSSTSKKFTKNLELKELGETLRPQIN